jgi:hypothetical protein
MPKAIKSPEQRKKKPKEVDNDKARKTIVRGTMTVSTDDAHKANHDKMLNASVATSLNSTTQSGTTIRTAEHVDVRTCISPTHTQQVMSLSDKHIRADLILILRSYYTTNNMKHLPHTDI